MFRLYLSRLSFSGALSAVLVVLFTANSAVLNSSVNKKQLTVGDKIRFAVTAVVPKGTVVTPPPHDNKFGNIVVKGWNMQKSEGEKSDSITFEYILTTYTPENCTIPSLPFVENSGNNTDTLYSDSIPLQIISVINSSDSTVNIRDLKPLQDAGKAPMWWLWLSLIIIASAAALFGGRLILNRLRKPFQAPPPKPPFEEALDALRELDNKQLLQKGLIREYVFELSEIFKRYIGRRYQINASDFTTEEMNAWIKISGMESKLRRIVEWFFNATDPVKFARYIPDSETTDRFGKEVWNFLELTRPSLEVNASEESVQNMESK